MANVPITLGGGASADLDQITAGASQILAPYVSVNGDGDAITGTIPSLGAHTWTPSTSAQTIASGQYLSGIQTISAVSQTNLSAANIKKGTTITIKAGNGTIWSVTGTWEGYIVGRADFYNRGTWGVSQHQFVSNGGYAGTSALMAGVTHATSYDSYQVRVALGPMNAYGYTKVILSGSGLSSSGGTGHCRFKSTLPTDVTDGTDGYTDKTTTSTAWTYTLKANAINAGNVYWVFHVACTGADSYVNRIYFA